MKNQTLSIPEFTTLENYSDDNQKSTVSKKEPLYSGLGQLNRLFSVFSREFDFESSQDFLKEMDNDLH